MRYELRNAVSEVRTRVPWLEIGLAAVIGLYFASLVRYGFHLGEDGDVIYLIYRAYSGQEPYIDFASGYAPGHFYGNAALFHLFGVNLLVLRWALAVGNTLAAVLLYRLARALVPGALAITVPLGYVALMPVFPGEFTTFNIPYPAWYVVLAWAASALLFVRFCSGGHARWMFVAGVLAGVGCSFKPNTGAFNLAALALALLFACPEGGRWWQRGLWWLLLLGVLGSVAAVFGFRLTNRDARLLLWPVFALGILRAFMPRASFAAAAGSGRFASAALALMGGFAVATVPWMAYYLARLGPEGFLRDVLYIGTSYALFSYLAIPKLGMSYLVLGGAVVAVWLGGRALARGWVRAATFLVPGALLAVAGGAFILLTAPMPEGFWRAVTQRLQPLAFGASILTHWAGVLVLARVLLRKRSDGRAAAATIALATGAPLMFLSLYPRADFFHWVLSAPITLALAAVLYWPLARPWLGTPRRAALLAAAPAYALIVLVAWPGLTTSWRIHTAAAKELVTLDLDRAPIVLEAGRRRRLEDLRRLVAAIRRASNPGDTLLGFPNLHLVNFLSGRQVPGRYGSFHPGSPDHLIEAEIIDSLDESGTPLIALNHDQQLYMGHAPLYYFMLREYVRQRYELAAEIGSYDLLRRRPAARAEDPDSASPTAGEGSTPPTPIDGSGSPAPACEQIVGTTERLRPESARVLAPCWSDAPDTMQERAVHLARGTRDPEGAVLLAQALQRGSLGPRATLLAVRVIGEIGDARSLPALAAAETTLKGRPRQELRTAIYNIALRGLIESYAFFPRPRAEAAVRADPNMESIALSWLKEPDGRLWFAGAWVAGVTGAQAAADALRGLLRSDDLGFQLVAGDALLRLGAKDGVVERLMETLGRDETFIPAVVFRWGKDNPWRARRILEGAFPKGNRLQRENIALIAGALGDGALAGAIREGLAGPDPRVRMASTWALGMLGATAARAEIEKIAAADPVQRAREFAAASIVRLKERSRSGDE